jgi:hypothetical protein
MWKIADQPWYILLLPLFFLLHNYQEFYGLLDFSEVSELFPTYAIRSFLTFAFFFIISRKKNTAGLLSLSCLMLYFFFAPWHQFLLDKLAGTFLARYSVTLLVAVVAMCVFFIALFKKEQRVAKFLFFSNVLLFTFVLTDVIGLLLKKPLRIDPADFFSENVNIDSIKPGNKKANLPDVYLLVFDEYPSSSALRQLYSFDNNLDTFLLSRKFKIIGNGYSNYSFTPFSVNSMLNMAYLQKKRGSYIGRNDYAAFHSTIKHNKVALLFKNQGYTIHNFSPFDFYDQPSQVQQPLLPIKAHLIYYQTFFVYAQEYVGKWIRTNIPFIGKTFFRDIDSYYKPMNDQLYNSTMALAEQKNNSPKFVYMHVFMPHRPWLPAPSDKQKIYQKYKSENRLLAYIYTVNNKIFALIDKIQHHNPNSVIVVMGDHGLRYIDTNPGSKTEFQHMNAIYFPSGKYDHIPDSLTPVNEFRIISNELFNTRLHMLKDSMFSFTTKGRTLE